MYTFQDLLDYFQDRPEIQKQLIANSEEYNRTERTDTSLDQFLLGSFQWGGTPEGHNYWSDLREELLNKGL